MSRKKSYQQHKFLRTKVLVPFLLLVAILGAGRFMYVNRHKHDNERPQLTKNEHAAPNIKVPTHQETSEGQTFPVPNDVPTGSIKDYQLITETSEYKIRELDGAYTITIYAIINNPSQADDYHKQLHDYKQAALTYLTQHGVDVTKVTITYDPAEAAQY
ncbi:MAG TPA: hypothetical protein VLH38_05365 [Patescibacteria group bacterium]|nr:hypothetical protein [Patescibacteria group bacterium]